MTNPAADIYQNVLDLTGPASLDGDVEVLLPHISLPLCHTYDGERHLIETVEDFAHSRAGLSETLKSFGTNQFIRLVTEAEFLNANYIEGHHVTHALRNATPVVPSFANRMVLKRFSKNWKVVEVESTLFRSPQEMHLLKLPDNPLARCDGLKDDARRKSSEPLALYQRFLNVLTQANVENDFEEYCDLLDFPYTSHGNAHDAVLNDADDVRPFFDNLYTLINDTELDSFLRIADHAEFISGDQICGYHTTRFLKDGADFLPAIKSRMILRRKGVRWFVKSVTNSVSNTEFPYNVPQVTSDLVTHSNIQKRTKTWPNLH